MRRPSQGRRSLSARVLKRTLLVVSGTSLACVGVLFAAREGASEAVAAAAVCERPYSDSSPWNTRLGPETRYSPQSAQYVAAIDGELSSSPDQYTYPVFEVTNATPLQKVTISGWFSNVTESGRKISRQREGSVQVPVPANAEAAAGSDAQVILINRTTGDEWGASHFERRSDGTYSAWNVYRYNTSWDGVPPDGFINRGAGVTYLSGLVRPCELARGRIDHALAFAYDFPTDQFVFPATKSDGDSRGAPDMPEGSRLQLDPKLSAARIRDWGCTGACFTIARALQQYGMYVIDNSGRPKLMLEYRGTARWPESIGSKTVKPIPSSAFRLVEGCTIRGTGGNDRLVGTPGPDYFCALEGNDTIVGLGGDDIVYAGGGADRVEGGAGNDRIYASLGADVIGAGPGDDIVYASAGADRILGGPGNDQIFARDALRDRIAGGAGRDRATVDRGVDVVSETERVG